MRIYIYMYIYYIWLYHVKTAGLYTVNHLRVWGPKKLQCFRGQRSVTWYTGNLWKPNTVSVQHLRKTTTACTESCWTFGLFRDWVQLCPAQSMLPWRMLKIGVKSNAFWTNHDKPSFWRKRSKIFWKTRPLLVEFEIVNSLKWSDWD
jgi:hypothetical protein